MLKIAKPFVDGVAGRREERSFVRMIVELARTLGLEVVAEGIETGGAARPRCASMGCDLGQGFYLSPPLSTSSIDERVPDRTPVQEPSRRSGIRTIDLARAAVRRANPP